MLTSRGSKKFVLDALGFVFVQYHSKFRVDDPGRPYRLVVQSLSGYVVLDDSLH